MEGANKMKGEKKIYLYPKNLRSSEGFGNFFIVNMEMGSKWLCHSTKGGIYRVIISDEVYKALLKDSKENRIRYSDFQIVKPTNK